MTTGATALHQRYKRGITWSKCTRTRRCQSLRKSIDSQHGTPLTPLMDWKHTVVLDLLVVLDRHCGC